MNRADRTPDRIVIISDFARVRGGASQLALLLAHCLNARNLAVTVFSGDQSTCGIPADSPTSGLDFAGVAGVTLLEQKKAGAALNGIWNRQAYTALSKLISKSDTPSTIYHVHGFLQTLSPAIFSALVPVRARVVIHAHDYFLACPNGAFFDYRSGTECNRKPLSAACAFRHCDKRSYAQKIWRLVRQKVQNQVAQRVLNEARIILLHPAMQPYLERGQWQSLSSTSVIRNPAQPFLKVSPAPHKESTFLFVGDIHTYKGVFVLAEAARKAQVPLCFAGEGVDRQRLQSEYPEFQFAGWQDKKGLAALAVRARAIVVPSLGPEPFGLTLVEAVACGLPVIVSDSALLSSEIDDVGAGVTFRAGDSDHLAQVLSRVSKDDDLTRRMSEDALAASSRFGKSSDEWCDEILNVYSGVLNGKA